jgi:hypothetical protein
MEKNNWEFINLQFVIQFKDNGLQNDFKEIPGLLKDVFTGDTTMLPIPDDAPAEIPRLILPDNNSPTKAEISKQRINLFVEKGHGSMEDDQAKFFLLEKIKDIFNKLKFETEWIGLILRSLNKNDEGNSNMQKFLSETGKTKFFGQSPSPDDDLMIHLNKKIDLTLDERVFKSALNMQIGSNPRHKRTDEQLGNLLMLDMNTRHAKFEEYSHKVAIDFVETVFKEQESFFDKFI